MAAGDLLTWFTVFATGAFVIILLSGMAVTIYEDILAARAQRHAALRQAHVGAATAPTVAPPLRAALPVPQPVQARALAGNAFAAHIAQRQGATEVGPVRLRETSPEVVDMLRGLGFSTN